MGNIVILDEITANKIAAGEVVERPASVVKEMIENSIDAGATSVSVEIANGGISKIKITDNGKGIAVDDVEIAFERHSTSKIRSAKDLNSIATLGFRGEALASISSVSKVELTTREKTNERGMNVIVEGGTLIETRPVGCPAGTTFVVRDLFYNTPARYKFLKKDTTEANYISDIINRMALQREDISFKFISKGKIVLHTPGNGDLKSVIFSIYGKDVAQNVLPVEYSYNNVRVSGFIGKPNIARGTRSWQSLYLNNRYIKSKLVSKAVEEAYATYLMKGKYPFYVLKIEIDTALVDVNVHPAKMEVRFSNEQDVFRCVHRAVSSVLMDKGEYRDAVVPERLAQSSDKPKYVQSTFIQQSFARTNTKVDPDEKNIDDMINARIKKNRMMMEKEDILGDSNKTDKNNTVRALNDIRNLPEGKDQGKLFCDVAWNTIHEHMSQNTKTDILNKHLEVGISQDEKSDISPECDSKDITVKDVLTEGSIEETNDVSTIGEKSNNILVDCVVIGQLFRTYILLQKGDEFYMIDQHAAHERVMFEKLRERYKNNENMVQHLLTPVVVDMQATEVKMILENKDKIERLGFEVDEFGNDTIIIRGVPAFSDEENMRQYFLDVVDRLIFKNREDYDVDETLYDIACKSAIKAHKRMDDKEIKELLRQLDALDNPFTCPHGRPTAIRMTKRDVEKMFKRIV
ncbi:MAG: DNA mismatch repair endonuclease MutL [Clostridiales bacterium]|nr:DNA mismatch repair endonuclease MutL [Clostridiales bacterium]